MFYAPPEQLANRQAMKEKRGAIPNKITPKVRVIGVVERKADIFSVGLMLYEMLLPPMRTISEKIGCAFAVAGTSNVIVKSVNSRFLPGKRNFDRA